MIALNSQFSPVTDLPTNRGQTSILLIYPFASLTTKFAVQKLAINQGGTALRKKNTMPDITKSRRYGSCARTHERRENCAHFFCLVRN